MPLKKRRITMVMIMILTPKRPSFCDMGGSKVLYYSSLECNSAI